MTEIHQARIPVTLQAVFLASNRGQEVHRAPPGKVGFKVFFRNWSLQRRARSCSSVEQQVPRRLMQGTSMRRIPTTCVAEGKSLQPSPEPKPVTQSTLSPQDNLDAMLRTREYSTRRYTTLNTAYYNKPTPLQLASYSKHIIEVVRASDAEALDALLSAGLSPNACNSYGESIVHMVCRRGDAKLLQVLLKHGAAVQVSDDYGRTPLHDACWSANPALDVFQLIVERDRHLLNMHDKRGCLPLSYVRPEHWAEWNEYLSKIVDVYWPALGKNDTTATPELAFQGPNSRPLPDPPGALPVEFAGIVASNRVAPRDAMLFLGQCEHGNASKQDSASASTLSTDENWSDDDDDDNEEDDKSEWDTEADFTEEGGSDDQELSELLSVHASLVKSSQSSLPDAEAAFPVANHNPDGSLYFI